MQLIYSIGLSVVGYFVLMYITTNLTGMVVRGFFRDVKLKEMEQDEKTHQFVKEEIKRHNKIDVVVTILFAFIGIIFLYSLYRYLNVWALVAALLMVFTRVPDLLWELRTGRKVTKNDRPRGGIHSFTDFTVWISLPILWWSIYSYLSH